MQFVFNYREGKAMIFPGSHHMKKDRTGLESWVFLGPRHQGSL